MYSFWNETISFISADPLMMLIDLVCLTSRLRIIKLMYNPIPAQTWVTRCLNYSDVVVSTFLSSLLNHGLDCDRDLPLTV